MKTLTELKKLTIALNRRDDELAKRNSQLEDFYNSCPDMIFIFNDLIIEDCNPRALRELGYSKSEIKGRSISDIIHPEDREKIERVMHARSPQELGYFVTSNRLRTKEGEYVTVLWTSWSRHDESETYTFGRLWPSPCQICPNSKKQRGDLQ
jgi:PAS domain S-box-containing protein